MSRRLAGLAVAALCALALVTGCAPQPAATPTPTPRFTSEEQAFKAAEDTYRAYVDASNKIVLSDPATFESVYDWEIGDALEAEKKSLTRMYSDGWVLGGKTYPGSVTPKSFSPGGVPVIVITACMDISETTVHDSNGKSLVGSDRPPFQPLDLSFVTNSGSPTGLLISSITGSNQRCGD